MVRNIHDKEALANLAKKFHTQKKIGLQYVTPDELYVVQM